MNAAGQQKQIFMENDIDILKAGNIVRLRLKPEITGVINKLSKLDRYHIDSINLRFPEASVIDAEVLILGDDFNTVTKKFPVMMLERV
jgi:hypothetical protein